MSLEDIKKKIIDDAKSEADKILKAADEEIKQIKHKNSEKLKEEKAKILSNTKTQAKNKARSILITANIESKNEILAKKRKIINTILEKSIKKISNFDDDKYIQVLSHQMKNLNDLGFGSIKIFPAKGKSALTKTAAEKVLNGSFEIQNEIDDIEGGFKVKSNETLIDFSFANLIEENRSELEKKLTESLFKG